MEVEHKSLDRISTLPQHIIETILCLVPIKVAIMTSILSKYWRYKWTSIPKLVFNDIDMFTRSNSSCKFKEPSCERKHFTKKVFCAVFPVLLQYHGPIREFTLHMEKEGDTCDEIDPIIAHLSKNNTLKKFTLYLSSQSYQRMYKLPISIFSLHQLTDLYLEHCYLDFKSTLSVFANLTSLSLTNVNITTKTLVHFLSSCPILKSLILDDLFSTDDDADVTIIDLFNSVPKIEDFSTSDWIIMYFSARFPRELPTAVVHLKNLHISLMRFDDIDGLNFLGLMIRSSPNLEKLKLTNDFLDGDEDPESISVSLEKYSDIWLEHLSEVEILNFTCTKRELEFVQLILAKSPLLKKVSIEFHLCSIDERSKVLEVLLHSPRASLLVEVVYK